MVAIAMVNSIAISYASALDALSAVQALGELRRTMGEQELAKLVQIMFADGEFSKKVMRILKKHEKEDVLRPPCLPSEDDV